VTDGRQPPAAPPGDAPLVIEAPAGNEPRGTSNGNDPANPAPAPTEEGGRERASRPRRNPRAAFFDDPVIGWAWRDPARPCHILADFFELMVAASMEHDLVYTTDGLAGAALWLPPAALHVSDEEGAAFAAEIERVTHEFAPAVGRLLETLDAAHPTEPHYYLPIVGTRVRGREQTNASSARANAGELAAARLVHPCWGRA
jgi:hypothetical protein